MADDYAASTATTGVVPVGGSATGNIETSGDADWFAVTLDAGTTYRFDLEGSATGQGTLAFPVLQLRGPGGGTVLVSDSRSGGSGPDGTSPRIVYAVNTSGTYYLANDPIDNGVGTYRVSATSLGASVPDDHAGSTATTGVVSIGGSVTGNIETSIDTDWFAVDLVAGRKYNFYLDGAAAGQGTLQDLWLELHDSGTTIGSNGGVQYTASATRTAYLDVDPANNGVGTYRVRAKDITPGPGPNINSLGGDDTGTVTLSENIIAVTTVAATDSDANAVIAYSISGGTDGNLFQINASTGALAFKVAPDFEHPADSDHDNSYVVQVRASDASLFDEQTITVKITDVPNEPPIFTSATNFPVAAGATVVGTVSAVDPEGAAVTYSVAFGQVTFQIDPNSGLITLLHPALGGRGLSLTVRASDGVTFSDIFVNVPVAPATPAHWVQSVDLGSHGNWTLAGTGDFNHDGLPDLLWTEPGSGKIDEWQMANGHWSASIDLGSHGSDQVGAIGDFNADGTSDILWYNPANGHADLWKMSNGQWAGSVDLGTHPLGWQPVGSGDFNNDGTDDVLWFNPTTGNVEIWKIVNGQWAGSIDAGNHPTGWQPIAFDDFDFNGSSDVLWYNPATRGLELWKMSNGSWAGSVSLGSHPAGWTPVGVGNFNLGATSDVVWFNAATGNLDVWQLHVGGFAGSVNLGNHPVGWAPVAIADLDQNGTSDIVWRETATNHVEEWLLSNS
jgi:hypothetical protein